MWGRVWTGKYCIVMLFGPRWQNVVFMYIHMNINNIYIYIPTCSYVPSAITIVTMQHRHLNHQHRYSQRRFHHHEHHALLLAKTMRYDCLH